MSRRPPLRAEDARHFCRYAECDFSVPPRRNAHGVIRIHRLTTHNSRTPGYCHAECGYRTRPYEGRYTDSPTV